MTQYLLDTNAFSKIAKVYPYLSDGNKKALQDLGSRVLSPGAPQSLAFEYVKTDGLVSKSISSKTVDSTFPAEGILTEYNGKPQYTFTAVHDRKCKDIFLKGGKTVDAPDVEGILHCILKDLIFVTDDQPARTLCECLAVQSISTEEFLKKMGICLCFYPKIGQGPP